jgi:deoxyribose-phosphate aldolase
MNSLEDLVKTALLAAPNAEQLKAEILKIETGLREANGLISFSAEKIAAKIDHTVLKPETQKNDIEAFARQGRDFGVASVCIQPTWISTVKKILTGSPVLTCTVIGFPLGANTTATKVYETQNARSEGADELDLVLNIGHLKAGDLHRVFEEVAAVKEACSGKALKVILETALLTNEEIIRGSFISSLAGADFVKTSTGFSTAGATPEHVLLMKRTVESRGTKVKASGGIRDYNTACLYLALGADRIGTSSTETILTKAGLQT